MQTAKFSVTKYCDLIYFCGIYFPHYCENKLQKKINHCGKKVSVLPDDGQSQNLSMPELSAMGKAR